MAVSNLAPILIVWVVAFGVAWAATPLVERAARRYGFMDRPSPRRDPLLKPRLGGLAMYIAFAVALALTVPLVPRADGEVRRVLGIVLGGAIVLAVGAADDRLDLPALPQLLAQAAAAAVAIGSGIVISAVTNPLGDPV